MSELVDRCEFMQRWANHGTPSKFWLNSFFFPQAFLTGALQNHARRTKTAIDRLSFGFSVQDSANPDQVADLENGANGVLVYGMYAYNFSNIARFSNFQ